MGPKRSNNGEGTNESLRIGLGVGCVGGGKGEKMLYSL